MLVNRGVARISRRALQARQTNNALFSTASVLTRANLVAAQQQQQRTPKPVFGSAPTSGIYFLAQ